MIRKEYVYYALICYGVGCFTLGVALAADPDKRHRTGMICSGIFMIGLGLSWVYRGYLPHNGS